MTTYCNICGDAVTARFRAMKRQVLCDACALDTPTKVSFDDFRFAMWPRAERLEYGEPGRQIEHSFYEDYIASTRDLPTYIKECSQPA
jgi:hypothetical protein